MIRSEYYDLERAFLISQKVSEDRMASKEIKVIRKRKEENSVISIYNLRHT